MSAAPQAMFVVEYPCDKFCRVEVDLSDERGDVTLRQLRDRADGLHRRIHEPELAEGDDAPAAGPEAAGRAPATVFLSAPARNGGRQR